MILNHCNFFSKTLKNHVDVNVLLPSMADNDCLFHDLTEIYPGRAGAAGSGPAGSAEASGSAEAEGAGPSRGAAESGPSRSAEAEGAGATGNRPARALYLLHGALDDYTAWLRNTAVERCAQGRNLAVVMPSGQNGFYSNARYGLDYFDFITEELPRMIEYVFPVSSRREDRYIAGASMGGYGAAKCALRRPGRYQAFGTFSGALDPGELEPGMKARGFDFFRYDLIFGGTDKVAGSRDDLYFLAGELKGGRYLPDAFVACGKEDDVNCDMSRRFCEALSGSGGKVRFMGGHGRHDWDYWEKCIAEFISWIG